MSRSSLIMGQVRCRAYSVAHTFPRRSLATLSRATCCSGSTRTNVGPSRTRYVGTRRHLKDSTFERQTLHISLTSRSLPEVCLPASVTRRQLHTSPVNRAGTASSADHVIQITSTLRVVPQVGHLEVHIRPDSSPLRQPLPDTKVVKIPYTHLRGACQCVDCVDPNTKQRNFTLGQIYREVRASSFDERAPTTHDMGLGSRDPQEDPIDLELLWIVWKTAEGGGDHVSVYNEDQLVRLATEVKPPSFDVARPKPWASATELQGGAGRDVLTFNYNDIVGSGQGSDGHKLRDMLSQLCERGIAILKGVPTDEISDQACELRKLAGTIGQIRNTFYGETWDVINLREGSRNVAYTNQDLGLHMDLLYFVSPPRFQLLHCLRNQVQGGASYFVDGLAAREHMRAQHPEYHRVLESRLIPYMYKNDGHDLCAYRPVFEKDVFGRPSTIAWSPPFQAELGRPVTLLSGHGSDASGSVDAAEWSKDSDETFFKAIEAWEGCIAEESRKLEFTMVQGDLAIFDNRRMLHARRGFRDLTPEERQQRGLGAEAESGEKANRWLKGCYLDGEAVWDRLAVLRNHTLV